MRKNLGLAPRNDDPGEKEVPDSPVNTRPCARDPLRPG